MALKEIIPELGIAIGGGAELGKGYIRAFDLYNGDTKWRFQSQFLRDLDNFVVSGDTLITFLSSTFVQIDIRSGEGYAMPLVRDDPQYNEGAMVYSAAFGLLGLLAYSALYNGHTAERSNMTIGSQLSNVHTYNGISYLATSKSILAIEPPGKILWEYKTPHCVNGHARIFEKAGRLFALYPGIITGQATNREAGAMAVQLDTSGKERAFAWLSDVKQQNLKDFVVNDKTMLIVMNNKILEMDLRTLQTISSQQFGNERLGAGLDKIVRPPYFILSDGKVSREANANKLYIENATGMKIEISKSLELVAVVTKSNFFSQACQIGPYLTYSNDLRTVICDAQDQKHPVEFSGNFKSNNMYAWDWSGKNLVILPVQDFELGD